MTCFEFHCDRHFPIHSRLSKHFLGLDYHHSEGALFCFKCKLAVVSELDLHSIRVEAEKKIVDEQSMSSFLTIELAQEIIQRADKNRDEAKREVNRKADMGEIRGLKNYGNTCYFNAALQLLYALGLPRLRNHKSLLDAFLATVSPDDPLGERGEQQDAHEFLIRFLALQKLQDGEFGGDIGCTVEWTTLCSQCKRKETAKQNCYDISLPLSSSSPPTSVADLTSAFDNLTLCSTSNSDIVSLIQAWSQPSSVTDSACEKCNTKGSLSLQSRILSAKDHLLIHLQRYSLSSSTAAKCGKRKHRAQAGWQKDLKNVHLSSSIVVAGEEYVLRALILHHGNSLDSGHYTAVCHHNNHNWYHFDDDTVKPLPAPPDSSANAYILAYSKHPNN